MPANPVQIGRFEILESLGRGGMGIVYLARDPLLARLVAIKLLVGDDPNLRARFETEARVVAKLRHRNIVTLFELGVYDEQPFIVMEYVEGESIDSLIGRKAPLTLDHKLQLVDDLAAGLECAHREGIVHRDIKPANLLLDRDGVLKILDFGIARVGASDSLTSPGFVLGSVTHMAPEQLMGASNLDARADMFSAGAVFYELLTYRRPFAGGSVTDVAMKILHGQPEPLATLLPDLDPAVAALVRRCLEKQPDARYADMADLRADLARVRARLGTVDAPPLFGPPLPPAPPPSQTSAPPAPPAPPPPWPSARSDRPASAPVASAPSAPPTTPPSAPPAMPSASGSASPIGTAVFPTPAVAAAAAAAAAPPVHDHTMVFVPPHMATSADVPEVQLVVTRSADARLVGRTVRVAKEVFTIGRVPECDLVLTDRGASRRHAEIRYVNEGFVLCDLSSSNGTYLNGRHVGESPLLFGSVITIGETDLAFSHLQQTSLPDLTGCVVADRYTLLHLLRESGQAVVYAARNEHTSGEVAVKLLSPELMRFPGYRDGLRREAQVAAKLHHPNICSVIDYGTATVTLKVGGAVTTEFLCFELMAGGSLADRLEEEDTIVPLPRAAEWLKTIGGALDYAHRHGVLHGDLKPAAIVFDEEEHPYLTDFSVAQQTLNADGHPVAGTPAYMAPEVWEDGAITPAAEQFALAAIAYYLVTGSRPFEGQENRSNRRKNFTRGPIAAHEEARDKRRDGVTRALSAVLARALATDAAQRFESATAFARAFTDALRHIRPRSAAPEIFISYRRETSAALAWGIMEGLKAQGIGAFIDTQGIDRAGRFPPQVERAIEDADVFVCLLSETTLQSGYVLDEIRAAVRFEKPMIPVMQEAFDSRHAAGDEGPAATLLGYQGLRVLDRSGLNMEHLVPALVRLIKTAIDDRDRSA